MDDIKLASLDQKVLYRGDANHFIDDDFVSSTNELFRKYFGSLRDMGAHPYDLDRIASALYYIRALLWRKGLTGKDKTAVEIGSGKGSKSIALANLFGSYIGIDINEKHLLEAQNRNRELGLQPINFIAGNAADILQRKSAYGIPEKIDVLILYAVLEHLTFDERAIVMKLADDVMQFGGQVLVMEVPNRLIPFDSHTLQGHFFNWLPDKFANELARTTAADQEIREMLLPWGHPDAPTLLARSGRGVSYHDFSALLNNPLETYSFTADGFDAELLNIEPFDYQQFQLYGYLIANVQGVNAQAFGRRWLDFVMSGETGKTPEKQFISPFWPNWLTLEKPPLFWQPAAVILSAWNPTWRCELESSDVSEIILLFCAPEKSGRLFVYANNAMIDEIDVTQLVKAKPSTWHNDHSVSISIRKMVSELRIEVDTSDGPILFEGCVLTKMTNNWQ